LPDGWVFKRQGHWHDWISAQQTALAILDQLDSPDADEVRTKLDPEPEAMSSQGQGGVE
jgi:hypothetical protein